MVAVASAVVALSVVFGTALAGTTRPVLIRSGEAVYLEDTAADAADVAVAWTERTKTGLQAWVRAGTNVSFGSRARVWRNVGFGVATDVCASTLLVAYQRNTAPLDEPPRGPAYLASRDLRGVTFDHTRASMAFRAESVDVACGGGRVLVAWQQRFGGPHHGRVRSMTLVGGTFEPEVDLGLADLESGRVRLAATEYRAFATWSAAGKIHLKRATIGLAPDHTVGWSLSQILGAGTSPIVAADENRVVVAWVDEDDLWVRISTDGGSRFGTARRLVRLTAGGGEVIRMETASVAVSGARIAVTSNELRGLPASEFQFYPRLSVSDNGGATWRNRRFSGHELRLVAFGEFGGMAKLAEVWADMPFAGDEGWIRYRREL